MANPVVGIIMGSRSDWGVMEKAAATSRLPHLVLTSLHLLSTLTLCNEAVPTKPGEAARG